MKKILNLSRNIMRFFSVTLIILSIHSSIYARPTEIVDNVEVGELGIGRHLSKLILRFQQDFGKPVCVVALMGTAAAVLFGKLDTKQAIIVVTGIIIFQSATQIVEWIMPDIDLNPTPSA